MSVTERRQTSDFTHIGLAQYPALDSTAEHSISNSEPFCSFVGRRQEDAPLASSLLELAKIACDGIDRAVSAGILLHGNLGRPGAAAISGEDVEAIDVAQFEHRVGPSLDASNQSRIVRVNDMHDAVDRYPEFSSAALRSGVGSTLSLPLIVAKTAVGVINIYADSTNGFGVDDEEFANSIAAVATTALSLGQTRSHTQIHAPATNLRNAMRSRETIEEAKGIYMAWSGETASDDALNFLSAEAARESMRVSAMAQRLVEQQTSELPSVLQLNVVHNNYKFQAIVDHDDARLTVYLRGELDVATQPLLLRALSQATIEGTATVYVDVDGLTFIDAYGMGTLVSARNSLRAQSRQLVVCGAPPNVAKLIAVAGLSELLDPSESPRALTAGQRHD